MKISKGVIWVGQKVVIYGPAGVGKTTLASQFPDPVFIDVEGSTRNYDVARMETPGSWQELIAEVEDVRDHPGQMKTLVIDSADWAETLCTQAVCRKAGKAGVEDFGYGKGYVYVMEEFSKLLTLLEQVAVGGTHVVFVAHAAMKKVEQPDEMASYDRWEMKCSKNVSPKIKEWADLILFCNFKTIVVRNEQGKAKGQGAERHMYAQQHACWDAKNRHNLPADMPMKYEEIGYIFDYDYTELYAKQQQKPLDRLKQMITDAGITEYDLRQVIAARGQYGLETPMEDYPDKFITGWIFEYWERILQMIKSATDDNSEGDVKNG